jgi:hypothetical protein
VSASTPVASACSQLHLWGGAVIRLEGTVYDDIAVCVVHGDVRDDFCRRALLNERSLASYQLAIDEMRQRVLAVGGAA